MVKRRNFLKLLPVGFLAAKFGGLVDFVNYSPVIQKAKAKILVLAPNPWKSDQEPIRITSQEQMDELFGKGSALASCFSGSTETVTCYQISGPAQTQKAR